ncbi:MAG TPA: hemolysin family protein [Acidimicrobiia bacterium]|nr:hemolysin family protein [Acidimicrobiia bacterium]
MVAALIAANGLFVAAEFALISVRRGSLEAKADRGSKRAKVALRELDRASFMLSGAQFGITATSLVVGFLAEAAVGGAVVRPVLDLFGLPESTAVPLSLTLAFLISTVVQMLFGELAPKNLALAIPVKMSLFVAYPIHWFGVVFGPIIRVFDGSAGWVTRKLFRVEVAEERHGGHSPEELARIIVASQAVGQLSADQGQLLTRAVELAERRVHEVMVPRIQVTFLHGDDPVDTLRSAARTTGHSRFPVVGQTDDDIVGTVHIKDLLNVPAAQRETAAMASIAGPALIVPETDRLRSLLSKMRQARRTFAVVANEYGGVAGIVTLEDVVEELVGEIHDEFDAETVPIRPSSDGGFLFDGTVRAEEAEATLGCELPKGDYETVAGLLIFTLERIPGQGEFIDIPGWRLAAHDVDGLRVVTVHAMPQDAGAEPPAGESP